MRCPKCDHSLWNVRGRICPECGEAFSPADCRFRPNTVEFCCAACGQPYYGIDPNGLLHPSEFTCVTCNAPCSMARDMVLRPAPGATEQQIQIETVPWPPAEHASWWRSAFKMVGVSLGAPTRVGRSLRGERPTGAVTWVLCLGVPIGIGFAITFALLSGLMFGMGPVGGSATTPGDILELVFGAMAALGGPIAVLFAIVIYCSGITWFIMRWGDRSIRFSRVFACWSYAMTPSIIALVPCIGAYCGWLPFVVWAPILAGLMLGQCCTAHPGRVVMSVLTPVLVALLGGVGFLALMIAMTSSAMVAMPPGPVNVGPDGIAVPAEDQDGVDDAGTGDGAAPEAPPDGTSVEESP